jgi:hypothetical protein
MDQLNQEEYTGAVDRNSPYRRHWPIEEDPPFSAYHKPTIQPGEVVVWKKHPDADLKDGWYTPIWRNKSVGLVIATRWVKVDWDQGQNGEIYCVPEATIRWNDGDTTNTSQELLRSIL